MNTATTTSARLSSSRGSLTRGSFRARRWLSRSVPSSPPRSSRSTGGPCSSENSPKCLDESIRYIEDFDRLHTDGISIPDFIQEMLALHGDRMNLTTLYHVAYLLSEEYPDYV